MTQSFILGSDLKQDADFAVVTRMIIGRRRVIVRAFSEWTAFSAARMAPLKGRRVLYPLIRKPDYEEIVSGNQPITSDDFEKWHRVSTDMICKASESLPATLSVGWAVKLINVYLKTRVYLAGEGRPDLIKWIHPPIDNRLINAIMREYHNEPEITGKIGKFVGIGALDQHAMYETIIEGCRIVAQRRGCYLIEVEELWRPDDSETSTTLR